MGASSLRKGGMQNERDDQETGTAQVNGEAQDRAKGPQRRRSAPVRGLHRRADHQSAPAPDAALRPPEKPQRETGCSRSRRRMDGARWQPSPAARSSGATSPRAASRSTGNRPAGHAPTLRPAGRQAQKSRPGPDTPTAATGRSMRARPLLRCPAGPDGAR